MLTSSPSPTVSPKTPFNRPFRQSYHRSSSAHSHASPHHGPQLPLAPPRRSDGSSSSSTHSDPRLGRSPSLRGRRQFVETGTQYSPEGYPPTARARPQPEPASQALPTSQAQTPAQGQTQAQSPQSVRSKVSRRRESSADATTAPPARVGEADAASQSPNDTRTASDSSSDVIDTSVSRVPSADVRPLPKRPRQNENGDKIMPQQYELCDCKELGVLVADMLLELVRLNDQIPLKDGQLTRFHSRAPPAISVRDYLNRLIVHATLSPPILLSMVYYIDRLCLLYPVFTISSLTVHRFLITAATVAAKGLSDSFWTNNVYARVGGVTTKELALLELEFLEKLDWKIVPRPEVLVEYYSSLVERSEGYVMETTGP
ncbi:cyclin-domain-containing protein [Aulographum hederae CBS 113979]|uniref:Cyclin-domain-containing protein n=1 Tax=Aulographum hederae CBS 113979 TaxID=1176131 RepID=A0A6G1HCX2_9PEZI|nr:cyclin-domain-containing protein [Aulographum hederae CBS 113979]